MSSHRDFKTVVSVLLRIIPENEVTLREKINYYLDAIHYEKHRDELWNQAPELLPILLNSIYFKELGEILNEEIQEFDAEWKFNLVKVYNNTS